LWGAGTSISRSFIVRIVAEMAPGGPKSAISKVVLAGQQRFELRPTKPSQQILGVVMTDLFQRSGSVEAITLDAGHGNPLLVYTDLRPASAQAIRGHIINPRGAAAQEGET